MKKGYDLLGLAQRAGKVVSGEAGVEAHLKKGKGELVLIASDASERTRDQFIFFAKSAGVHYIIAGDKIRLGIAIGKSPRSVLCLTEKGFARRIRELFLGEISE